MAVFGHFYLDKEKDIIVDINQEGEDLSYVLRTPNHATGNLITNLQPDHQPGPSVRSGDQL